MWSLCLPVARRLTSQVSSDRDPWPQPGNPQVNKSAQLLSERDKSRKLSGFLLCVHGGGRGAVTNQGLLLGILPENTHFHTAYVPFSEGHTEGRRATAACHNTWQERGPVTPPLPLTHAPQDDTCIYLVCMMGFSMHDGRAEYRMNINCGISLPELPVNQ